MLNKTVVITIAEMFQIIHGDFERVREVRLDEVFTDN